MTVRADILLSARLGLLVCFALQTGLHIGDVMPLTRGRVVLQSKEGANMGPHLYFRSHSLVYLFHRPEDAEARWDCLLMLQWCNALVLQLFSLVMEYVTGSTR